MCFCNPTNRTPFCGSEKCQLALAKESMKPDIKFNGSGEWRFPADGDFPAKMESILYVPTGSSRIFHGYMDGSVWLSYTHGDSRPTTNVKCWMYAPEIPEHHTMKGVKK